MLWQNGLKNYLNRTKKEKIASEEVIVENKRVKITNLTQYRLGLDKGTTDFDFSELDVTYEDIQNINLENLNLNINLREEKINKKLYLEV